MRKTLMDRKQEEAELNVFFVTNLLLSDRWCIKSWKAKIPATAAYVFCVCVCSIDITGVSLVYSYKHY